MRRTLIGAVGALTILSAGKVSAQTTGTFGEAGSFVVSAERLTGLYFVGHFAFAVGPYLDIPLTGDIEYRTQVDGNVVDRWDGEVSALSFGLSAGLLGWL